MHEQKLNKQLNKCVCIYIVYIYIVDIHLYIIYTYILHTQLEYQNSMVKGSTCLYKGLRVDTGFYRLWTNV